VPGISIKVLAKVLKDLEAHHFIACTVHPGPPVVVDYYVLPYARTLNPVIEVGWYLEQARHQTAKHKRLLFEGPRLWVPLPNIVKAKPCVRPTQPVVR
jgi:DNA-binding HxlR family transcriptional regulator